MSGRSDGLARHGTGAARRRQDAGQTTTEYVTLLGVVTIITIAVMGMIVQPLGNLVVRLAQRLSQFPSL